MRLNITARHFNLSDRLKQYTEKEVRRLKRYYDGILDCDVILDWEKQAQVAEIVLHVYGTKLTVREKSEDMYKSINLAVDKLERQLKRYKGKLHAFDNTKARDLIAE